jgi:hypothetical protein
MKLIVSSIHSIHIYWSCKLKIKLKPPVESNVTQNILQSVLPEKSRKRETISFLEQGKHMVIHLFIFKSMVVKPNQD